MINLANDTVCNEAISLQRPKMLQAQQAAALLSSKSASLLQSSMTINLSSS